MVLWVPDSRIAASRMTGMCSLMKWGEPLSLQSLVIARHSHLKWKALDPLEAILMALCGISIAGFTLSVFCDVLTREIGRPWLWLQLVTTGFFVWRVFVGMA